MVSARPTETSAGVRLGYALVLSGMVVFVLRHEGRDLAFEIAGQVVVLKQDAVLERLMPALDLALGLRVIGRYGRAPFFTCSALREISRNV
jgi:hypothetical protein